ncbi:hypothetical protein ACPW96_19375 [Micromonospora sp. DT81.3]|uniref:hypothetical protein n=1 Tax=Micromonospora sp. DT81.3 TaxID=3416523 RepID=UPI003CEC03E9
MTLIVFVVTNEYAIVASDRRMTTLQRGKPTKFEDVAMKTFLLNGQVLMGYTGVAVLDGMPMERWVADALWGVMPDAIPETLRYRMNDYYRRHPEVRGLPHHFRLAGFGSDTARRPATFPIGFEVSNARWVAKGDRVESVHVGEFKTVQNIFGNRRQAVGAVGAPYSLRALRSLENTVRFALRRDPQDPSGLFDPIVQFIRAVADRSGGTVGHTVMVASIPRSATPILIPGWTFPLGENHSPAKEQAYAVMYPEDVGAPVAYAPAIINPDVQMLEIRMERQRPDLGT